MYKHSCLSEIVPDIAHLSSLNMENVFSSLGRMKNRKPKKEKKRIYIRYFVSLEKGYCVCRFENYRIS